MFEEGMVSQEAAEILTIMVDEMCFPANWEASGNWLEYAQKLAQYVADQSGKLTLPDAQMLVTIGGMLIKKAQQERQSSYDADLDLEKPF